MTLAFSRIADGFRAWFSVVRSNGTLRPGALQSEFTALVIDPADTFSREFFVSESVTKPGLYYFDVPTSYLTVSGTGHYGVSVEINITGSPIVTNAFSDVMKITQDDFDSLALNVSASVDVDSIVSGVWDANGSIFNTSGTTGYLLNLAAAGGIDIAQLVSGVWNAEQNGFNVSGTMGWFQGLLDEINLYTSQSLTLINGISSSGVPLTQGGIDSVVTGVWNAADQTFNTSGTTGWLQNRIDDVELVATSTNNTVSTNLDVAVSTRAAPGDEMALTTLARQLIVSGVWNAADQTFNVSGTMGWLHNLIDTINLTTSQSLSIVTGISSNQVSVDDVVTGVWDASSSTFNTVGTMGRLQNTAAAGGVDVTELVSGVWNANAMNFNTSGTTGAALNLLVLVSGSVEKVRKVECGRWKVVGSQQIMYDDDGLTPLAIFNLYDSSGNPFVHDADAVVERVPTGSIA